MYMKQFFVFSRPSIKSTGLLQVVGLINNWYTLGDSIYYLRHKYVANYLKLLVTCPFQANTLPTLSLTYIGNWLIVLISHMLLLSMLTAAYLSHVDQDSIF